jgi:hypothetical protein
MRFFEKIYNGFVKILGDIKVFKFPLFLVYDPGSYLVKGDDTREVMDCVQPGDILVRGYLNYLDGYIIPGLFSHAGLYLGEVPESAKAQVNPEAAGDFKAGKQIVIHSMAEGVFMEDIINFCRCDYMLVLRRNPSLESDESKKTTFQDVFNISLSNLGKDYDFKFDFSEFNKLSCTELVYECCKGFLTDYDVKVRTKTVMFIKKRLITPDDYVNSKLDIVWRSKSVTDKKLNKVKSGNKGLG